MGHVDAGFDLREVRSRILHCLRSPAVIFAERCAVHGDQIVRNLLQIRYFFSAKRIVPKGLAELLILHGCAVSFHCSVVEKAPRRVSATFR